MASGAPVNQLTLAATSVADDLGFVALADLSHALGADATDYRVIGGHMVTALVGRWGLGADLYRETGDTDLGVPPVVVRNQRIIERLFELGYERVAGNRFARTMTDVPVRVRERAAPHQAIIDILVPAYGSRARQNHRISEQLVTTEVPGLSTALRRAPVRLQLNLRRLNGDMLDCELSYPDEVSAVVLKGLATGVRTRATDVVDVWRCLEVAFAAGVEPAEFSERVAAESAAVVRTLFEHREGTGMEALVAEQRLSREAADERFTRLRALIGRVFGTKNASHEVRPTLGE
jgi:hypothetical protein